MHKNCLPEPQNYRDQQLTIFDQAIFRQIPKIDGHKPEEQDKDGFTVAMILAINNITIPNEWYHNPNIQNKYGMTVAMYQARNGKIPDKQWEHNKYLRGKNIDIYKYGVYDFTDYYIIDENKNPYDRLIQWLTVKNFLENQNIQVPKYWNYNVINNQDDTKALQKTFDIMSLPPKKGKNDCELASNKQKVTVALSLAKQHIIPPMEWMHDINIKDGKNKSIREYLQDSKMPVPLHWKEQSLTIFDQACYGFIPSIIGHKPEEQNEDGFTVAMILAINNIDIPKKWYHKPEIQNKYGMTVAMIFAKQQLIPNPIWNHDPSLQSRDEKYTVAMFLFQMTLNPNIPQQWIEQKGVQDNCKQTMAMKIASSEIIPEQCWNHDPSLQNILGDTVASILATNSLDIPQQWYHDPLLRNNCGLTLAEIYTEDLIEPPKQWCYDPIIENKNSMTIGIAFALQDFIPSKQWMYDVNLKNQRFKSLKHVLQLAQLPVPKHWGQDKQMTIFDQACFSIIPDITGHRPDEQDEDGFTVAMILACNGIVAPKEWYHDPLILNRYGYTVALLQAKYGIIPTTPWYHDKFFRVKCLHYLRYPNCKQKALLERADNEAHYGYYSVQSFLHYNDIEPSYKWKYTSKGINEQSEDIIDAYTTIPKVKITSKTYYRNILNQNVAIILSYRGILDKNWFADPDVSDIFNRNIKQNLFRNQVIQAEGKQYPNHYLLSLQQETCQLCNQTQKQRFVKTVCGHKICWTCFYNLIKQRRNAKCPICNKFYWFLKISDLLFDIYCNMLKNGYNDDDNDNQDINTKVSKRNTNKEVKNKKNNKNDNQDEIQNTDNWVDIELKKMRKQMKVSQQEAKLGWYDLGIDIIDNNIQLINNDNAEQNVECDDQEKYLDQLERQCIKTRENRNYYCDKYIKEDINDINNKYAQECNTFEKDYDYYNEYINCRENIFGTKSKSQRQLDYFTLQHKNDFPIKYLQDDYLYHEEKNSNSESYNQYEDFDSNNSYTSDQSTNQLNQNQNQLVKNDKKFKSKNITNNKQNKTEQQTISITSSNQGDSQQESTDIQFISKKDINNQSSISLSSDDSYNQQKQQFKRNLIQEESEEESESDTSKQFQSGIYSTSSYASQYINNKEELENYDDNWHLYQYEEEETESY